MPPSHFLLLKKWKDEKDEFPRQVFMNMRKLRESVDRQLQVTQTDSFLTNARQPDYGY